MRHREDGSSSGGFLHIGEVEHPPEEAGSAPPASWPPPEKDSGGVVLGGSAVSSRRGDGGGLLSIDGDAEREELGSTDPALLSIYGLVEAIAHRPPGDFDTVEHRRELGNRLKNLLAEKNGPQRMRQADNTAALRHVRAELDRLSEETTTNPTGAGTSTKQISNRKHAYSHGESR